MSFIYLTTTCLLRLPMVKKIRSLVVIDFRGTNNNRANHELSLITCERLRRRWYIYIYIYIEREREGGLRAGGEREREKLLDILLYIPWKSNLITTKHVLDWILFYCILGNRKRKGQLLGISIFRMFWHQHLTLILVHWVQWDFAIKTGNWIIWYFRVRKEKIEINCM